MRETESTTKNRSATDNRKKYVVPQILEEDVFSRWALDCAMGDGDPGCGAGVISAS